MRTLFPLTPFKNAPKPQICPKFVPAIVLGGFQSGGLKFGKICQNLSENYRFSSLDKFFPNFSPPDWNPPKQSLGQILDKFGVSGVFEGCKGEKGSQRELEIVVDRVRFLRWHFTVSITTDQEIRAFSQETPRPFKHDLIGSSQTYRCFKPGCLQFLRRSALLRSFAPFCALLRTCACFL